MNFNFFITVSLDFLLLLETISSIFSYFTTFPAILRTRKLISFNFFWIVYLQPSLSLLFLKICLPSLKLQQNKFLFSSCQLPLQIFNLLTDYLQSLTSIFLLLPWIQRCKQLQFTMEVLHYSSILTSQRKLEYSLPWTVLDDSTPPRDRTFDQMYFPSQKQTLVNSLVTVSKHRVCVST